MLRRNDPPKPEALPDTGLLFSSSYVASEAHVPKNRVSRLVRDGRMPRFHLIDNRRYWDLTTVFEAIRVAKNGEG